MRKKSTNKADDGETAKLQAFEEAWYRIRLNHEYVVTYGFTGFHPKYFGLEDTRVSQALENIKPYLGSLRKPRLVQTPEAAWWLSPVVADTAHEALLGLFNPPEQLFGVQFFLSSREFEELVHDARLELVQCLKQRPLKTPEAGDEGGAGFKFNLAAALRAAHLVNGKLKCRKPLSQRRIGEIVGASQAEVSRDIGRFLGAGWMSEYKAALHDGDLSSVFRGFFRAGGDIEAIDDDENCDDLDDITGSFDFE